MSFYQKAERTQYWRVVIMACAAFIFNTTEFVPVALLTDIGQSFDMQSSDVGLMMTVYAWTVMIMSLPAMLATGDMERKGLLLKLFVIFYHRPYYLGHCVELLILLIARMCIAVAHSLFWAITASLVMRVAPKNKKTQAIGMLAIGTSLATILGLTIRPFSRSISWLAYYFRNHCSISFGCDGIYYAFITKPTK